ncbi:MAG: hypothetical protein P0S96_03850 [Simkaniaceae bacterium]|nr:hypothetical protein [Candidatus Sacchlamyda saccharinae]
MIKNIGEAICAGGIALKRASYLGPPVSKEVLYRALFGKGPAVSKASPLVSGLSTGSVAMASNYNTISRDFQDLGSALGMQGFFSRTDMIVAYQTFGTLTGINAVIGLVKLIQGYGAKKVADSIEDKRGSLLGRVSMLASASLGAGGVSFAGFRGFAIYNEVNGVTTTSLLGRITHGLSIVGMACFTFFYLLLTVVSGIKLHDGLKLKSKLQEAGDFAAQAAILEKKYGASPGRVLEKLIAKTGSKESAEKLLQEEAISTGKAHLQALMKELGLAKLSDADCDEVVKDAVQTQVGIFGSMEKTLTELGLNLQTQKVQLRKDEKMERVLSSTGAEAVKELRGSKATQKLVDVIATSNKGKIKEYALNVAVLLLGIATLSFATVLTGGMGVIIASAVMIAYGLLMTAVDGYYLLKSYREETPAKHDKKLLVLSSVLAFTSLVSMLALGFSGFVSFGLVPIMITAILTAFWLGQNGVSLWVMNRNEQRALVKNPTFEGLLKALDGGNKELAERMLKNLTEDQRKLLENEMRAHSGKMQAAIGSVIEKVDGARKAHLDSLRLAIA